MAFNTQFSHNFPEVFDSAIELEPVSVRHDDLKVRLLFGRHMVMDIKDEVRINGEMLAPVAGFSCQLGGLAEI